MNRRDMAASALHVRIGRITVDGVATPTDALPDRDTLAQAIAARLGGAAAEGPQPGGGLVAAIADAVAHRVQASWSAPRAAASVRHGVTGDAVDRGFGLDNGQAPREPVRRTR